MSPINCGDCGSPPLSHLTIKSHNNKLYFTISTFCQSAHPTPLSLACECRLKLKSMIALISTHQSTSDTSMWGRSLSVPRYSLLKSHGKHCVHYGLKMVIFWMDFGSVSWMQTCLLYIYMFTADLLLTREFPKYGINIWIKIRMDGWDQYSSILIIILYIYVLTKTQQHIQKSNQYFSS